MKGQSEAIVFILLFIVSIFLFTFAAQWSRNIFQENMDFSRLEASERFMKELDNDISNIIRFGGLREIEFNLDGTVELVDSRTIGIRVPSSLDIQNNWVNISEGASFIRERKEGETIVLHLIYPQSDYRVEFFTDGSRLSQPSYVKLEKNDTFFDTTTVIRIKISFV
ncbi:MAG: hypothetical protein ABIE55_00245 [Candidatus Aenigmatarchaeota archaeon]